MVQKYYSYNENNKITAPQKSQQPSGIRQKVPKGGPSKQNLQLP